MEKMHKQGHILKHITIFIVCSYYCMKYRAFYTGAIISIFTGCDMHINIILSAEG